MTMPGGFARCENVVVAARRKQLPCFFLTALAMCKLTALKPNPIKVWQRSIFTTGSVNGRTKLRASI
jgi:hypothetical protein